MTAPPGGVSHDVRVWAVTRYRGKRGTTYRVRWHVAGVNSQRTFRTAKLADAFRAELLMAARDGEPFDSSTGLPSKAVKAQRARSWFQHAVDYAGRKWPTASPRHRKGIAEALTTVTVALSMRTSSRPADDDLRRALFHWAFAGPTRLASVPEELRDSIEWLERTSIPLREVAKPAVARRALEALAMTLDGRPAASATFARKRATFHNALEYAVELELIERNPLEVIRFKAPSTSGQVDRRVVANPTQARALLAAVWDQDPALAGFFACMYYAGMRPAEVRNLRRTDCILPEEGWGHIVLTGSHQTAGAAWTDSGESGEERALKHRPTGHTRRIPAHPELVQILSRHLASFAAGADGRLFVSRTGRAGVPIAPPYLSPVSMASVYRAWHRARQAALTPEQVASPLARRPYDLRHACVSTWLNAGVPAAQVAEWAGHSVQVLLRVYAQCIDGQEELAIARIEAALGKGATLERFWSRQP